MFSGVDAPAPEVKTGAWALTGAGATTVIATGWGADVFTPSLAWTVMS